MDLIKLEKINEVYVKVICDSYIFNELSDYFTFYAKNYMFHPKYKNKIWDGKIRLLNYRTKLLYIGLVDKVKEFCESRGYNLEYDELTKEFDFDVERFIKWLKLPVVPRDYQIKAFLNIIKNKKSLILSVTGSGKSLIIYMAIRYFQLFNHKGLIMVPTIALVKQMYKDFEYYGYESEKFCHCITAGIEKKSNKILYISTWQSLQNVDKKYFEDFNFVIVDECHTAKAKVITGIMENCVNSEFKVGTTGTLEDTLCDKLTLEGLFGGVFKASTTSDLIDKGQLSKLDINCIIFNYENDLKKSLNIKKYDAEVDFIISNENRNNYIKDLALGIKGNTLILFQFVEKHGLVLYNLLKDKRDRVFFIHGNVDVDYRENVRSIAEKYDDVIIIASYGTFSTGINIKNLNNLIFSLSFNSKIRNLQSIGRILRICSNKDKAVLYDLTDDLRIGSHINHTLKHFKNRIDIYSKEKFPFNIYKVNI